MGDKSPKSKQRDKTQKTAAKAQQQAKQDSRKAGASVPGSDKKAR